MARPPRWLPAVALIGCGSDDVPLCFRDGFAAIDADRWTLMSPGHTDVTANGRLVIAPPAATNTNDGLRGTTSYDLSGGFVEVELEQYLTPSVDSQSELVVKLDDDSYFFIGASILAGNTTPSLLLRLRVAGTEDLQAAAFDPAVRYWRIAHDAGANLVDYMTSIDHVTWATQRTTAPPFSLAAMRADLEVDTFNGGVAAPGQIVIDSVTVAAPSCDRSGHELEPHLP